MDSALLNSSCKLLPVPPDAVVEIEEGGKIELIEQSPSFAERLGTAALRKGTPAWKALTSVIKDVARNQQKVSAYRIEGRKGRPSQLLTVEFGGRSATTGRPQLLIFLRNVELNPSSTELEIMSPKGFRGLIGRSEAMRQVYRKIAIYGASDATVVVTGETGTGKELVAQAIHDVSPRRKQAFVAINCSAISQDLFETELFGHDRGAFTGADKKHRGRFERASGGTLFLDEVGDMAPFSQTKLLRILETGELERVGGENSLKVDVRIVAATSIPLEEAVGNGKFRADLFHRLTVFRIHMPPLREHREDIHLLTDHFLNLLARKYDRELPRLASNTLRLLEDYAWPGNIRELRNLMERLLVENSSGLIQADALQEWIRERMELARHMQSSSLDPIMKQGLFPALPPSSDVSPGAMRGGIRGRKLNLLLDNLVDAYRDAGGNVTKAAGTLGIHKASFYRWMKRHLLDRQKIDALAFPAGERK